MYFRYGTGTFPKDTVLLQGMRSDSILEGLMPVGVRKTWSVKIKLYGSTLADLNNRIVLTEALFSRDGGTAYLLDNNGNPTAHNLGAGSRAGCKVHMRPSYDPVVGIEMSRIRTFNVELSAEYDVPIPGLVVQFNESVTIQGNGGPDDDYLECVIGKPIHQVLKQFTKVTYTQSGTIVGRYRRIFPDEWVQECLPGYRKNKLCSITPMTAQLRDGTPGNPVERNFPVAYNWVFHAPGLLIPRLNNWRN